MCLEQGSVRLIHKEQALVLKKRVRERKKKRKKERTNEKKNKEKKERKKRETIISHVHQGSNVIFIRFYH